jgi:hypothetical protein
VGRSPPVTTAKACLPRHAWSEAYANADIDRAPAPRNRAQRTGGLVIPSETPPSGRL